MTRTVETTASALKLRSLPKISVTTDTGARLIAGQTAIAVGESFDKRWLYLDAASGDGWASVDYLRDVPRVTPGPITVPPKWPRVPVGRDQIVALFGDPCKPDCHHGRVNMPGALPLSWEPTSKVTQFNCHILMVPVFTSIFAEIQRRGFWDLLEDFGGCYNCREQRGTTKKSSTHSWGIGIDVNARSNPLGAKPKMPRQIIGIFEDHGFTYGGTWQRPDGMHFQYARGY